MSPTATRSPDLAVVAPPVAPAIETLVEDYLAHCQSKGLSPKTIRYSYGYPLRGVFLPWCARQGITEPAQLSVRLLERFTSDLREHGGKEGPLAPHSIQTYAATLNHFLAWAHHAGETPDLKTPAQRVPKKLVDVLSREEIDRLEHEARNERDKLIVRVLAETGLRLGELVGLTRNDLRAQKGPDRKWEHYLHVTGKGQRDREVPIPGLYNRILKYVEHYRPNDAASPRIFLASRKSPRGRYEPLTGSGINQLINTLAAQAGIKKRVYPHLLRHSFATWYLANGGNPVTLAKILGHSSLTMIMTVYAHLSASDTHNEMERLLLAEK